MDRRSINVFQSLSNDAQIRQSKLSLKVDAEIKHYKNLQEKVTRPNMKSDTMLAYKFRDEFVEAVN